MDRATSKLVKADADASLRRLGKVAGFKTRSKIQYAVRDGFLLVLNANYSDIATGKFERGDAQLFVRLQVKPVEADEALRRICQMDDGLEPHSVDPILGLDVVRSLKVAERVFPVESLDAVPAVCQEVVDFAVAGFDGFLAEIGGTPEGFYRHVLTRDPTKIWGDELLFPIAYIQLGQYSAALQYINDRGRVRLPEALNYRSKGRSFGDWLTQYCTDRINGQPQAMPRGEPTLGA